jgi:hypothetical protein
MKTERELAAILKVLKEQQGTQKFSIGQLFNTVHPGWEGEADIVQKFNGGVKDLEEAGFIIVTAGENVERVVRITVPGEIAANRFK